MPPKTFITPSTYPSSEICAVLAYPDDKLWTANLTNALLMLTQAWRWEQVDVGDLTPAEAAEAWRQIVWGWLDTPPLCPAEIPTPFWEDGEDVDDSAPADAQTWYGAVSDPDAPADELSFVENIGIWAITGFIAYAGDIGAAILFHTQIAPRFVLAWKRGDIGELFRVVIDSADYASVDTTGATPGDIVTLDVLPDPDETEHTVLIIKMGETP